MLFPSKISRESLIALPLGKFSGHIRVVDTPEEAGEAAVRISTFPLLGFDTETRPSFTKGLTYKVSLLQIAHRDQAWLFRLHKTGIPPVLAGVLSSPEILKVGNAPRQDVAGLQKIAPFEGNGFVDLQEFVNRFGVADNSLMKITAIVLGFRISKAQQLSNWEVPRLTPAQMDYAATDAWVCYEIYKKLVNLPRRNSNEHF